MSVGERTTPGRFHSHAGVRQDNPQLQPFRRDPLQ